MRLHPRIRLAPGPSSVLSERQAAAQVLEYRALRQGADIRGYPELDVFGGLEPALLYLHRRWVTYVGAAVDDQIETGHGEPVHAVRLAWLRVRAAHPGLAAILTHHGADPAVVNADRRHSDLIAPAAGCLPEDVPTFRDAQANTPLSCSPAGGLRAVIRRVSA